MLFVGKVIWSLFEQLWQQNRCCMKRETALTGETCSCIGEIQRTPAGWESEARFPAATWEPELGDLLTPSEQRALRQLAAGSENSSMVLSPHSSIRACPLHRRGKYCGVGAATPQKEMLSGVLLPPQLPPYFTSW